MALKRQGLALVALVAGTTVGAIEVATAGPNPSHRITVCYNRRTGALRYSPSGRCLSGLSFVVGGKPIAGARGPLGPRGVAGVDGGHGAVGAAGPIGGTGANGVAGNGAVGPAGPVGGTGANGVAGGTGGIGGSGAGGGAGTDGGTGPRGGTGQSGVNVLHTVSTAPATSGVGTLVARCASGDVVTGGGFFVDPLLGPVTIKGSFPTGAAGDEWSVFYSGGATISVTGYAICVTGTMN